MTDHSEIRELLPLAAAGVLTADEQRVLETHLAGCEECARQMEEWRVLAGAMAEIPTPMAPEGLVERAWNRVVREEAERREKRLSDVLLGFLMLFGWTLTLVGWLFWKLTTGGSLMDVSLRTAVFWLGGSTLVVWITAGAAIVMLGSTRELRRRYL